MENVFLSDMKIGNQVLLLEKNGLRKQLHLKIRWKHVMFVTQKFCTVKSEMSSATISYMDYSISCVAKALGVIVSLKHKSK